MNPSQQLFFRSSTRAYPPLEWTASDKKRIWLTCHERVLTLDDLMTLVFENLNGSINNTKCSLCSNSLAPNRTLGLLFYRHSVLTFKTFKKNQTLWVHGYPENAYRFENLQRRFGGKNTPLDAICLPLKLCSDCEGFYAKMYLSLRRASWKFNYEPELISGLEKKRFLLLSKLTKSPSWKVEQEYRNAYENIIHQIAISPTPFQQQQRHEGSKPVEKDSSNEMYCFSLFCFLFSFLFLFLFYLYRFYSYTPP